MLRSAVALCAGLILGGTLGCGGSIVPGSAPGDDGGDGGTIDGGDGASDASEDGLVVCVGPNGDLCADAAGEGGLPACDMGVCPSPESVAGFAPTWKPPTGLHQGACTPELIDEYYMDCLDPDGAQDCSVFETDPQAEACETCLTSDFQDPTWGPLVQGVDEVETNTSGCIALLDPSATSCAMSVQAQDECQHAACDDICQGGDATGFDSWVTCSAAANSCGCESYFQASDCVQSLSGAQNPAAPCLVGQTFEDFYYSIAPVFCGP